MFANWLSLDSAVARGPGLYLTAASGTGGEELLLPVERALPASWYGRRLLYETVDPNGALWMFAFGNRNESIVDKKGRRTGRFSPNGRWVAYASTEGGRAEIEVVSFPDLGVKERISTSRGRGSTL